jgi:hypothetical protein
MRLFFCCGGAAIGIVGMLVAASAQDAAGVAGCAALIGAAVLVWRGV